MIDSYAASGLRARSQSCPVSSPGPNAILKPETQLGLAGRSRSTCCFQQALDRPGGSLNSILVCGIVVVRNLRRSTSTRGGMHP